MSEKDYIIQSPKIKDNWILFPNSIFSKLITADCNDTVEGICYNDKSLEECINKCKDSPLCDFGYYISNPKLCVPLWNSTKEYDPFYRIRNKSIYPELKNSDTTVFFNKDNYDFPPNDGNNIFYMDNFNIQNVETNYWLEQDPKKEDTSHVFFNKKSIDTPLQVQMIQLPPNLGVGIQYVKAKYGDMVAFNIPRTTLMLQESAESPPKLEWIVGGGHVIDQAKFRIMPVMPNKKIGDYILYSDIFCIMAGPNILGITPESNLERFYFENYNEAKRRGHNVTFRFIPQMKGYYCNKNSKCTEISLKDMVVKNEKGYFDEAPINRQPKCWGLCIDNKLKTDLQVKKVKNITIFTFIIIFIIAIIAYFIFRKN